MGLATCPLRFTYSIRRGRAAALDASAAAITLAALVLLLPMAVFRFLAASWWLLLIVNSL